MKTRLARLLILVILITGVSISPTLAAPANKPYISVTLTGTSSWTDDFNSPTLDSRWSWAREDPTHWSLTSSPNNLRIISQPGNLFGTGPGNNNQKNILLTNPSMSDFQITTKVSFNPTQNFQNAALLVYQDDDNYISLERVYGFGNSSEFILEQGGVPTFTVSANTATTTHLRIIKRGNTYTGLSSFDGATWNIMGQFNAMFSSPKIGLGAGNGGSGGTEIPANFDYFSFIPLPAQAVWTDDFNSTNLNSRWSWIREDPTHWSLAARPGFMRITTQQDNDNILITPAPGGDFQVTTRVELTPTQNYQSAALMIYSDDGNSVQITHAYVNRNQIDFDVWDNYVKTIGSNVAGSATFLRITRQGSLYSGYYSSDGVVWTPFGSSNVKLVNPFIAITAADFTVDAAEIPADFDFVKVEFNSLLYLPTIVKEP
jgi:beta-xylosidase